MALRAFATLGLHGSSSSFAYENMRRVLRFELMDLRSSYRDPKRGRLLLPSLFLLSLFLLVANILFPGTCTSTHPNKARYPLLRLFVSEEGWRPLFLVVIAAMENFLSEKVINRSTIIGAS